MATPDRDTLRSVARDIARVHPSTRAVASSSGAEQALAWEAILVELALRAIVAILAECKRESPDQVRHQARKLRDREFYNVILQLRYNRNWRAVERAAEAEGAVHLTRSDITALTDELIARAATADPATIGSCMRAARA